MEMTDAPHGETIDVTAEIQAIGMGALSEKMGIEITEAFVNGDGHATVVGTMPVEGNTQPYGLLHGGASGVLAESLGSVASAMTAHHALGAGYFIVGLDLNCTHHKAMRTGKVRGIATVLSAGRTLVSTQIAISDESGAPVCTARLTCLIRKAPKD
jgi:1,4-dihydroxy-2-naphthoyl-CoA hydrolase